MQIRTRTLAGIPFAVTSLAEASNLLCRSAIEAQGGADIHLLNAYSIALAERDMDYRDCVVRSSCNLPDGKPLSVLTRMSKARLAQVRGPSFFEKVMDEGRVLGVRHFLLGSTPETLAALKVSLETRYPGVSIVGTLSPPFRASTEAEVKERDATLMSSLPHIVWVGLGTPKQDFEARRLARDCSVVAVAVGAAFDFSAGTKREAPPWVRTIGAEWLYRLAAEPRRLWRRYLIGNLVFVWAVVRPRRIPIPSAT